MLLQCVFQLKTENEEDGKLADTMADELRKFFGWNEEHVSWKLTKKQVDCLLKYTAQMDCTDRDEEETLSLLTDDLNFLFLYLDSLENPNRQKEEANEWNEWKSEIVDGIV